jgi:hypothetical protein
MVSFTGSQVGYDGLSQNTSATYGMPRDTPSLGRHRERSLSHIAGLFFSAYV